MAQRDDEDLDLIDREDTVKEIFTKEKIGKKTAVKKPSMWNVVFLNDDYTPMEFVVMVLEQIFHKSRQDATVIMLDVHKKGKGIAGTYTYEVAETKLIETMDFARTHEHPLLLVLQEA
jgi:ATP-dependent Clp protease adaptor protein ClpS